MRSEHSHQTSRILVVGQNYWIAGGSDRYMWDLTHCLQQSGIDVAVFAAKHPSNLPSVWDRYFPDGASFSEPGLVDALRYLYSPSARAAMSALLDENNVRLAHLNIYYGRLTASILRPLVSRGVPIVQTLHEYKLVCPTFTLVSNGAICDRCRIGAYTQCVVRRCNRGSLLRSSLSVAEATVSLKLGAESSIDRFIAISEFSKSEHVRRGVNASKIRVIPNFVRIDGVEVSSAIGGYILYFGRLERLKGIFTLLDAASMLRSTQFIIAGTGNASAEVREVVSSRRLTNVNLVGHLSGPALESTICGAFATVIPSEWYEPFGLTTLESFARGRCVIGSRIGGIPEVITEGVDGFLFEPGNSVELSEKIRWLDENRTFACEMGRRGREKVESEFSWGVYLSALREVYAELGVRI